MGAALDTGTRGAGASNEVLTPNAPLTAAGGYTGAQGVHLIRLHLILLVTYCSVISCL